MSAGRTQRPRSGQDRRQGLERRLAPRTPNADRRLGFDRREHLAVAVPFDPAMHPRYQAGEGIVFERDTPPEVGDEVLVVLHDGRRLVRLLAAMDAQSVTLQPVNGAAAVVPRADVQDLLLVVGRTPRQHRPVETDADA